MGVFAKLTDNTPAPSLVPVRMGGDQMPVFAPLAPPNVKPATPHNELGDPMAARVNELGDSLPPADEPQPIAKAMTPQHEDALNRFNKATHALASPWGSPDNHPGKLGRVAHIFSEIGNIAGDILAPNMMDRLPGTERHNELERNQAGSELEKMDQDEGMNAERGAQTANVESQTEQRPGNDRSRRNLEGAQAREMDARANAASTPDLAHAYATAVQRAIGAGTDPAQDPVVQHLSDAITSIQKQPAEAGLGRTTDLKGPDGKVHTMGFDAKTGKYDIDNGESGFKPTSVNLGLGQARFDQSNKNNALKLFQTPLDSAERFNVMAESYEKAVKDHDQQAMLNLLANHLGMTMGLQKGARMTKDLIQEAQHSQPWLHGMQAKWGPDGYLAGVTLSPPQMRQMVDLGKSRFAEDYIKANNEAQYVGVNDGGPERAPSPSVIRYYLAQAKGNAQQAKQLAAHDGWSVK